MGKTKLPAFLQRFGTELALRSKLAYNTTSQSSTGGFSRPTIEPLLESLFVTTVLSYNLKLNYSSSSSRDTKTCGTVCTLYLDTRQCLDISANVSILITVKSCVCPGINLNNGKSQRDLILFASSSYSPWHSGKMK